MRKDSTCIKGEIGDTQTDDTSAIKCQDYNKRTKEQLLLHNLFDYVKMLRTNKRLQRGEVFCRLEKTVSIVWAMLIKWSKICKDTSQ